MTAQVIGSPAGTVGFQPTTRTGNPAGFRYDNLSFYKAGIAVTSFNITAAADYIGGAVNGQLAMRPTGGAPTNAVVTGLTYANGPLVLGAEVGIIDTQGDARLTGISQRHEFEVAFGGNYKLAPASSWSANIYTSNATRAASTSPRVRLGSMPPARTPAAPRATCMVKASTLPRF